jgi:hypothetical protein
MSAADLDRLVYGVACPFDVRADDGRPALHAAQFRRHADLADMFGPVPLWLGHEVRNSAQPYGSLLGVVLGLHVEPGRMLAIAQLTDTPLGNAHAEMLREDPHGWGLSVGCSAIGDDPGPESEEMFLRELTLTRSPGFAGARVQGAGSIAARMWRATTGREVPPPPNVPMRVEYGVPYVVGDRVVRDEWRVPDLARWGEPA